MNDLHWLFDNDYQESGYRAKMILLRDEGYTVPEIRKELQIITIIILENGYTDLMKKVLMVLYLKNIYEMLTRLQMIQRKKDCIEIASNDPRKYRLKFSTWSLGVLAGYIMEEKKLVESISHTEIKNVLVKHGIEWRNSKTVLGKSRDPEYELKKIGLKN